MYSIIFTILFVLALTPLALIAAGVFKSIKGKKRALATNIIAVFTVVILAFCVTTGTAFAAEEPETPAAEEAVETVEAGGLSNVSMGAGVGMLAAALCTAVACIGAGLAVASSASAAIGAISEKPEVFGKAMIFVALAEGVALYGMLISIQIINLM